MRRFVLPSRAASRAAAAAVAFVGVAAFAADAPVRIPLVVGLSTVRAVAERRGDYESVRQVTAAGPAGYSFTVRGDVPDGAGGTRPFHVSRAVPVADHLHARAMRLYYHSSDPKTFPGTTPGVSADIVNELRQGGSAQMTYVHVNEIFGMPVPVPHKGTVTRVGAGPEDFAVIVNGRRSTVRVLHAKGRVTGDTGAQDLEFHVLDDPDNPLMLTTSAKGWSTRLTRIDFPVAAGSAASIEGRLAANQPAEVYGIYFSFASDRLRPESDTVLQEVSDLLKKHRDWKLQVDGHTDAIGGAADNLDLSRRRAAAVKAALVQRFGVAADRLATGGYGQGRPKDTNATLEGRALNRRVELRRL
jgi:outer membrane protein OmpA-like peptidoglycan-associated protein